MAEPFFSGDVRIEVHYLPATDQIACTVVQERNQKIASVDRWTMRAKTGESDRGWDALTQLLTAWVVGCREESPMLPLA